MAGVLELSTSLEETSARGADSTHRRNTKLRWTTSLPVDNTRREDRKLRWTTSLPVSYTDRQVRTPLVQGTLNYCRSSFKLIQDQIAVLVRAILLFADWLFERCSLKKDIPCFGDQNQTDAAALGSPPAASSGQSDEELSTGEPNDGDGTCHRRTSIHLKEEKDDMYSEDNQNPSTVDSSSGEQTSSLDNPLQPSNDSFVISSSNARQSNVPNDDPSTRDRTCCRRMSISSRKDFMLMIASTVNVMAEILALTFEQLGGKNDFKLLLLCGGMAFISLSLCLMEICINDEEVDFYPNILGLLFAISQFVVIVISGILLKTTHKNPIQISISSFIFAVAQLAFGIVKKRHRVQISQPNDAVV